MKILHVVGARPNFMKAAPVIKALGRYETIRQYLVHTGQHYDKDMSGAFFNDLGLPKPDVNLGVGSGSHAWQTARIMECIEPIMQKQKPDLILVYGDVNSTVASALVSAKILIPCGHVEAGLRSFDRTMPEEINRILTDRVSDLLFTPSKDADKNLRREGIPRDKIHLVGNVMIDTLIRMLPEAKHRFKSIRIKEYGLVTLHRPSNVDREPVFMSMVRALAEISSALPLVFPVHPRTKKQLERIKNKIDCQNLHLIDPLGYVDFLAMQCKAKLIISDSGGIQEEATYLGVPCLTLRKNTERPITVDIGTNVIVGQDMNRLKSEVGKILSGHGKKGGIPPLWDGHASERIAKIIISEKWKK